MASPSAGHVFKQPASVWAITFATAVSFVGIGLVSPILPTIAEQLDASAFQSMLLFTSYLCETAATMFFAGFISTRIGIKATLVTGLVIIILFASLAGLSDTVGQIIGLRAGWGVRLCPLRDDGVSRHCWSSQRRIDSRHHFV
ncbi:MAG TPA: MFS transporter [Yaniella sp.]